MKKFSEYFDEGSHQRKVAQDDDVEDLKGTQPKKYYAGDMKKSTKQARARHFAKGAKMDDDNPAAYKPAPGDKSAKTKPSKHTLKYKKMFGEKVEEAFKVGDKVKISKTASKGTKSGHKDVLGKTGKIIKDYGDGDMKVNFGGNDDRSVSAKDLVKEETLNEKIKGLEKKAKKSGISYGILKKVYDRGMAAWRTGHRPGTTPQQWAFARVNSFITGGGARKADADLWKKR